MSEKQMGGGAGVHRARFGDKACRIFSIKRRTPNKRWVQINNGSTGPSLK